MSDREKTKLKSIVKYSFLVICLVILFDTYIPGKSHQSSIKSISINYEQYFNAGGNGHYSFSIVTEDHSFYIDEKEKDNFSKGNNISYRLSPIFNEIQQFESESYQGSVSSLRLYTGTLFPILFMLIILLSFKYDERMGIVLFVTQVAIIANLIYLLN